MKTMIGVLAAMVMAGCSVGNADDESARETAVTWADAYFNCDYAEASQYVTEESVKWLRLAASNTTENDLALLREENAVVEGAEFFTSATDTLRVVQLRVSHYLAATPLGEDASLGADGRFNVTVVLRNGAWRVRMEGLPRSERQSRD